MEEISAFLGKETVFEGKMTFEGVFRLDGKFEGEIFESGTLIVGETAVVKGKIGVNTLIIKGQVELATRIGKDRTTIANALRLLKLPLEVRNQLLQNRITSGHARAILSLETKEKQKELCSLIIQKGLSVREAEALAKRWSEKSRKPTAPGRRRGELESQLNSLQDSLRQRLGTKVRILSKGKKGKIEIEYYSHEDLGRIVEAILGK